MRRSQKTHDNGQLCESTDVPNIPLAKVRLENGWNSKQMITEGETAIPLETRVSQVAKSLKSRSFRPDCHSLCQVQ